jgi:MFS family permease
VILACRIGVDEDSFRSWGWRLPFLASVVLLAVSLYIRLKLEESPVFEQMKAEGRLSRAPIRESFGDRSKLKRVLITLFGITTGMTVIWYTSHFYALFFMQGLLQVDYKTSCLIFAAGLTLGLPLTVFFGALSDRIGRKPIMIAGLVLGGLTLIPAFHALADFSNAGLLAFAGKNRITISADAGCTFSLFAKPVSDCDKARNFFSRNGLSYALTEAAPGDGVTTAVGDAKLRGFDEASYRRVLSGAGFHTAPESINYAGAIAILVWLSALTGMVYGPMAAFLVEMFPAPIRSTSLSLPYHLGVGLLGGFLPFVASALVVYYGSIFAGLWYPTAIALATAAIGIVFLPETKDRQIR